MSLKERRLFRTDLLPSDQNYSEFFMQVKNSSETHFQMKGNFPRLWRKHEGKIIGPLLFDDDYSYKVIDADYVQGFIWLEKFA